MVEYLDSFLIEAVSAALPAEWDVECRDESARVLTTVTSHVLLFFLAHQHKACRQLKIKQGMTAVGD